MKELLVKSIDFLHIMIAIFLAVGGYLIPIKYLPIYFLCLPFIIIDWNDKDGLCWITKLNNMIKQETLHPKTTDKEDNFLNGILQAQGIMIDYKTFDFLLYVVFISSWGYAYYRLCKKYKINVFTNDMVKIITTLFIVGWISIAYVNRM